MDTTAIVHALLGGLLIGLAAAAFLLLSGRIAGISGVIGGLLTPTRGEIAWRLAFVAGLVAGGSGLARVYPVAFPETIAGSPLLLIAAGLLVGVGTRLGGGCTSGHGVCGTARISPRSIVATLTFIAVGALTVALAASMVGG
ncbi:MAG: YeeE/YedE thiosulfate transporter family protein [Myxococcota bacterium]